tara:strand:- start:1786 stop:2070 length:285 start_codon:yes stop_codon:yes gene_type:complete
MTKKKQDLQVLDEVMVNTFLAKADCQFEALMDTQYYLYSRLDSSSFVSLVEPEYWDYDRFKIKFIGTVLYTGHGSWKLDATASELDNKKKGKRK